MRRIQHVVVVIPIDTKVDEAQHVAQEDGDHWHQSLEALAVGLPTICQPPSVNFFTSFARPAHDGSGSHHSRADHGAWPSGCAANGPQECAKLGHADVLWPAEPHTLG